MGLNRKAKLARAAYGAAFTVLLPVLLAAWAWSLSASVRLPEYRAFWPGVTLAGLGALLTAGAMLQLAIQGGGLPMNAFPPPRLVTTGVYAIAAHPIYLGFLLICAGASLSMSSAAGLWVVTPVAALGCASLIVGFESIDLERRFGFPARYRPFLSLPRTGDERPSVKEALSSWFLVLLPWLISYESTKLLGEPPAAIDARLPFEKGWPVWEWTELLYASAYLLVPLAVFLAPSRTRLRTFALQGLLATTAVTLFYLCVPIISPPRSFHPQGTLGRLLALEQASSLPPVAALPAFHVLWACFAAELVAARSPAWRVPAWSWAVGVSLSCLTTGMHASLDVAAAFLVYFALKSPLFLWTRTLAACERVANSWKCWRVGPVRIINHGLYAGGAAALGMLGMCALAGPAAQPGLLILAASTMVGAALWAQFIEGAPSLLRPFGYYGAILGGILGAVAAGLVGQPVGLLLAAAATMAPWIQAVGRLRCLVQGCCHGRPTSRENGIRVSNESSRVVKLAGLRGIPIHATQLYSILGNTVIGALLLRLWFLETPLALLSGLYLILSGLARFAEEAYRGEPQTRQLLGLPIYQHLSVLSVLAGVFFSMAGTKLAPPPSSILNFRVLAASLGVGAVYWFAMGVDFPESRRRFSRLSG